MHIPLLAGVNRLSRLSGKVESPKSVEPLRMWTQSPNIPRLRKILAIKLDHLGDFIIAIPAMRNLRVHFATDKIILVCGSWNKNLAEALGLFDEILVCDYFARNPATQAGVSEKSPSEFQAITRGTYDIAIDFRVDLDTRFLLSRVDARVKCGIGTEFEFPFLDVALPLKNRQTPLTENAAFCHAFGVHEFMSNVLTPGPFCWEIDFSRKDYCLIFGPYTRLPVGEYKATFHFDASGLWLLGLLCSVKIDVGQRTVPVAALRIGPSQLRIGRATVTFSNSDDEAPIEFRIYTRGRPLRGSFRFFGVTVEGDPSPPGARDRRLSRHLHRGELLCLLVTLLAKRTRVSSFHSNEWANQDAGEMFPEESIRGVTGAICIAPVSNSPIRDWPLANYSALVRLILGSSDRTVLLLGSEEQRDALDQIERAVGGSPRVLNLSGKTHWTGLPKLFKCASLVICNNSGFAHFAAACGVPVLAIYSGSHSPEEWGPRGDGYVLTLSSEVPCSPCGYDDIKRCAHQHRCMTSILPEVVFEKVTHLLSSESKRV